MFPTLVWNPFFSFYREHVPKLNSRQCDTNPQDFQLHPDVVRKAEFSKIEWGSPYIALGGAIDVRVSATGI
jgi:hypothetical protein